LWMDVGMDESTHIIQADFDRIALLTDDAWDHNRHYHDYLLHAVPPSCRYALEVGCGTGVFSRLLAGRADRVLALDLSPQMIRIAKERSAAYTNIDFEAADARTRELPTDRFDCIVSVATLHHLPASDMLSKMRRALAVGGRIIVLDLFKAGEFSDALASALAVPVSLVLRLRRTGRLREPREVREAWAAHGRHDSYLMMSQVRRIASAVLPGAEVKQHLLWRYSLIWEKREGARGITAA